MEPLVLVTWRDAHFHQEEDVPDDYLVRTAGFLLAESPEFQIAQEQTPDEHRAITCIPVALIEDVTFLEAAPDVRDEVGKHSAASGSSATQALAAEWGAPA